MAPRVLLLGGHGKIALHLTPLLLARNWQVTSVIRNPEHKQDILNTVSSSGKSGSGTLDVLVSSLDEVKSPADAKAILDQTKPNYVVWAAGAGGKGAPSRTYQVDQDAAKHFIYSAFNTPSITKFLLISHSGSRRKKGPWMADEFWEQVKHMASSVLPDYCNAKLEADEYFTALDKKRVVDDGDSAFQGILLRPWVLSDAPATGRVELGKTLQKGGNVTRADVAIVADELLARNDTRGWIDVIGGNEPIVEAVERVAKDKVDAIDGEDVDKIYERFL